MQIDYKLGSYRATGDHDPQVMEKLGWRYFSMSSEWRTINQAAVIPLVSFCVGAAKDRIAPLVAYRKDKIAESAAADSDLVVPVGRIAAAAGKDFRGYQKGGIKFVLPRKRSLIGDIPRLGKMIQGIGRVNMMPRGSWSRGLIICPANAKLTWCERWPEWTVHDDLGIDYCDGNDNPNSPALVMNWELLARYHAWIMQQEWDWIIADELHRCGGAKSNVTKMTFGPEFTHGLPAKQWWLGLSGTPIGTRPVNFWPICRFMDPLGLGRNKWGYMRQYCGATKANDWDCSGSTNEEELQFKARAAFMVRRDMEVGGVPPGRQTVHLPAAGLSKLIQRERSALSKQLELFEELVAANSRLTAAEVAANDDAVDPEGMAVQDLTLAALPMMIEFIEEQLETEQKIVVFCHHRAVAKQLQSAFRGCAFVIGGFTPQKREAERRRFQDDPKCRVFVGNIAACCENLELAAANVIVFCELVWQTGILDQAEMRVWLPTKDIPIQIWRLVVAGSATADMADEMEKRQEGIARATVAKRLSDVNPIDMVKEVR